MDAAVLSERAGGRGGALALARRYLPELGLALVWGALLLYNLGGAAPWWDEGWTMSVGRNLLERGHYGRLKLGEPAPGGLEAAPPVVGMAALGMALFGPGVWQARLVPALCAAGALAALYLLGRRLYGVAVARGALAALLLLVAHPSVHPLLIGRQVLGEMPMLLALLLGYLALRQALARSPLWLLAAMPAFALALRIKAQTLPFLALSLLAPIVVCLALRRWRAAAICAAALAGGHLALRYGLMPLEGRLLAGRRLPGEPVAGLVEVVAQVLLPFNRLFTLQLTLTWLLPLFAGLCYAAWRWAREARARAPDADALMRLALIAFSGSWWAWYLAISVGAPRYVFPALVISGLFLSALLADLTGGFAWRTTLRDAAAVVGGGPRRRGLGAMLALLTVMLWAPVTLLYMGYYYTRSFDSSVERVAHYLNTTTPPGALIETYESELHFFLRRPYHYPPDQLHVELIRRTSHRQEFPLDYDPLATNPDYVVIGTFGANNVLYDEALASGRLRLIHHDGLYDVYVPVGGAGEGAP
ncbi:MAG TPA: glycosyltransferase family 39 protein [Chloroflexaceae bacterium]|nr:glycosyltransferase family 39 protein [Chloroflexaceae bacterium]